MRKEDNEVLKYNHGEKSVEVSFIIYADLESLHKKMSTCYNKPKKSSTTKKKYLWDMHNNTHISQLMQQNIRSIIIRSR